MQLKCDLCHYTRMVSQMPDKRMVCRDCHGTWGKLVEQNREALNSTWVNRQTNAGSPTGEERRSTQVTQAEIKQLWEQEA